MQEYIPVLIFLCVAVVVPISALVLSGLLQARGRNTDASPYECGIEPLTAARDRYSVQYYIIAVLFVVFDVETIFLFPWAVKLDRLGLYGFIEMAIFFVILLIGYAYARRKGALDWVS